MSTNSDAKATLINDTLHHVPSHILGYPRIGNQRQTKFALEHYWKGKKDKAATRDTLY